LADIVTAVRSLKRLSRVTRAAAKLHLRTVVSNPKHRVVSHVSATETEKREPSSTKPLDTFKKGHEHLGFGSGYA